MFNIGPSFNVRRNEGAGNNIIFVDASGAFAGPVFEQDDASANSGEVRWTYTNPLRVWTGTTGNAWNDPDNWEDISGTSPASVPTNANTVQIPDVSAGSGNNPIIDNTSGDGMVENITIFVNANLTINHNRSLTVVSDIANSGGLVITGTGEIGVGGSWTNNGTFSPGNSTVTLSAGTDVTMSGGISFL